MKYNFNRDCRQSIRLKGYDYSSSGAYFITICTYQRACLFGKVINGAIQLNEFGQIVADEWERSPNLRQEIELDSWIVMPNHFHGIVFIKSVEPQNNVGAQGIAPAPLYRKPRSLGSFIAGFKMSVTKRINALRETPGAPIWQRNYYENIIRNEVSLDKIRQYVQTNPLSWNADKLHSDNPS